MVLKSQPLLKCNKCGIVLESKDCPEHEKKTGHKSWTMIKRVRMPKGLIFLLGVLIGALISGIPLLIHILDGIF